MKKAKKVGLGQNNPKSKLFYTLLVIVPIAQFIIFWVYVNFNSILLSFKVFDNDAVTSNDFHFGIKNFLHWFSKDHHIATPGRYSKDNLLPALAMTMKSYLIGNVVGLPLGLFFSYYMFKKMPGAGAFRILLFMPSIISAAPLSIIYKEITYNMIGSTPGNPGWLDFEFWKMDHSHDFFSLTIFNLFISFGTSVLMYTNKMDGIAPEIIESAHLDGANGIREFWYIVLPQTFAIIQVFLITGFAGTFTNQHNAFMIFEWDPPKEVLSLGMLLWNGVRRGGESAWNLAPYAALGLIITVIVVPLTFLFRWLLDKYGWKEE